MKLSGCGLLILTVACGVAGAADTPAGAGSEVTNAPPTLVTDTVRAAMADGVAYLLSECRAGRDGLPVIPVNRTRGQAAGGSADPDRWGSGFLGDNGCVLATLRLCGVAERDPVVRALADRLNKLIERDGPPDTTWDVAWLALAFCRLSESAYTPAREMLLSRLLDGQITDGPARGLWGPVCVNTRLLAAMQARERKLREDLAGAGADATRKSDLEAKLADLLRFYPRVSQLGRLDRKMTRGDTVAPPGERPVMRDGAPYYFQNQTLADLESSELALTALREAARQKLLPGKTPRPMVSAMSELLAPEKAETVFERAAAALAKTQAADGGWTELNVQQPCQDFQELGVTALDPALMLPLESPRHALSIARGLAALQAVVESSASGSGVVSADELAKGRTALLAAVAPLVTGFKTYQGTGAASPWDLLSVAVDCHRVPGSCEEDRRDVWEWLARKTVRAQNANGSWGSPTPPTRKYADGTTEPLPPLQISSSLTAWRAALAAKLAALPEGGRKSFAAKALDVFRTRDAVGTDSGNWRVLNTACALEFLASGVRPPIAGYIRTEELRNAPYVLSRVVEYVEKDAGVTVGFTQLKPDVSLETVRALPVLCLVGGNALKEGSVAATVRAYMATGGVVVVELRPGMNRGEAEGGLRNLVPGGRTDRLSPTTPWLAEFKGTRPDLLGVVDKQGDLKALFLPLAANESDKSALQPAKAVQTVYLLIKSRLDPRALAPDYALQGAKERVASPSS